MQGNPLPFHQSFGIRGLHIVTSLGASGYHEDDKHQKKYSSRHEFFLPWHCWLNVQAKCCSHKIQTAAPAASIID